MLRQGLDLAWILLPLVHHMMSASWKPMDAMSMCGRRADGRIAFIL